MRRFAVCLCVRVRVQVGTLFRVTKIADIPEEQKLSFIKEIGFCHMRILDGLDTMLQLTGLIAKLCCAAKMRK